MLDFLPLTHIAFFVHKVNFLNRVCVRAFVFLCVVWHIEMESCYGSKVAETVALMLPFFRKF